MCALNQFLGSLGIVVGVCMFVVTWTLTCLCIGEGLFQMDFQGKGSFVPLLAIYLDITKFVLGLASGSIALLVGATTYRPAGATGPPLVSFASPLCLLALSLICGVLFMAFLTLAYEAALHNTKPYTRCKYSMNLAFGFTGLFCFAVGYSWLMLIFIVTGRR